MSNKPNGAKNGSGKGQKSSWSPIELKGYVNVEMTAERVSRQKAWKPDVDEVDTLALRMVEGGLKVTLKYDVNNCVHMATATGAAGDNPYAGWYLSGRGSSPFRALKQLLFVHYQLLQGNWLEGQKMSPSEETWE